MRDLYEFTDRERVALDFILSVGVSIKNNPEYGHCFYNEKEDYIGFIKEPSPQRFLFSLFHELTHWSGKRVGVDILFPDMYIEELTANEGGKMLMQSFGLFSTEIAGYYRRYKMSYLGKLLNGFSMTESEVQDRIEERKLTERVNFIKYKGAYDVFKRDL